MAAIPKREAFMLGTLRGLINQRTIFYFLLMTSSFKIWYIFCWPKTKTLFYIYKNNILLSRGIFCFGFKALSLSSKVEIFQ